MTFPFKSISKSEVHRDTANDVDSNQVTDSVLSNTSDRTVATNSTTTADAATISTTPVVAAVAVVPKGRKKRFMIIDETKLPKEEAERLSIKRAYNRECADRARKRSKETVQELHLQVEELHADKCELRQQIAHIEKEIQRLKDENKALTLNRFTPLEANIMYARHHHNVGNSIESMSSHLNLFPKPITTALSMLQQQSCMDDGSHYLNNNLVGSLVHPSWDLNKFLLLQRTHTRQQQH